MSLRLWTLNSELNFCGWETGIRTPIEKLIKETSQKGMTLVVTRIYWKNGRIKFEIGVAKGKKLYDKRETEMKKTVERETRTQIKDASR
jgi:SsrA-binding protein